MKANVEENTILMLRLLGIRHRSPAYFLCSFWVDPSRIHIETMIIPSVIAASEEKSL